MSVRIKLKILPIAGPIGLFFSLNISTAHDFFIIEISFKFLFKRKMGILSFVKAKISSWFKLKKIS